MTSPTHSQAQACLHRGIFDGLKSFREAIWPGSRSTPTLRKRLALRITDMGVDGIMETQLGELHAYQGKFRTGRPSLNWSELSTFIGLADRADARLLVTNCDNFAGVVGERARFYAITGNDLDKLTPADFTAIRAWLEGGKVERTRKAPLPHQGEALDHILTALRDHDRATALMACGTGKTLVALWVAERLAARRILVLVPSLALLRQTLHEWTRETSWPALAPLCVCSDPNVKAGSDEIVLRPSDLDFPVTTDRAQVRAFLAAPFAGVKLVFSTYQSAPVVAAGMQRGDTFDLALFDEAHKTAGREGVHFGFALTDKNLPIRQRLFLTATPRHYDVRHRDREGDARLVCSMDAPEICGPVAHQLPFAEAARRGIICRYQVVVSVVTSGMVNAHVLRHGEVIVQGDAVKARHVANQLALRATVEKHGVGKIFTFHRSVASAHASAVSFKLPDGHPRSPFATARGILHTRELMTIAELNELFSDITLPKDIQARLESVCATPEGDVESRWVHKLITEYYYSPNQIALQRPAGAGRNAATSVVFADVVVYRDLKRRDPFIVIEVKKRKTTPAHGVKQAESYARNLGAEYHVWSDWFESKFFKTAKYLDQSTPVGNIPSWAEGREAPGYMTKDHLLPPFKDEEHLREVVRQCHHKIFFNLGHDPAKAFDELMKVLFLKMYDERVTPKYYKFAILPDQSPSQVATDIRALFASAVKSPRYRDVFTTRFSKPGENIGLDLDDDTIFHLVKQFQSYSLVATTATLEGVDIKGTVFERMVGSTFRGELGAYFTPRELVEFCISAVEPSTEDTILDPSCGSGGFLIMAIKHIRDRIQREHPNLSESEVYSSLKDFSEKNIFGVDINERMVRVTKMNMIMHGDGHSGIYNSHGLSIGASDRLPIREGSISRIFSNPPFAGREEDPTFLARFETAQASDGTLVTLHKAIPFVEMIIRLLEPNGIAALVLPNGIFNSPSESFKKLRQIMYRETSILGVVGLPHWVFFHTGCDVQGCLLFLKKGPPKSDYKVFIDWADHVGFDAKGAKTKENDLPAVLDRFKKRPANRLFPFSLLKKNDRIDALFYRPGKHDSFFGRKSKLVLGDIVEPHEAVVSKSVTNMTTYRYLEVGGVDPDTGKIIELNEYVAGDLPSRAKYIVREGMVLLPNHRNSIAAKRSPVLVGQEHDGIVVTSRFIPFFCKVPPRYVFHVLNLDAFKEKLLTTVTGGSSTEIKWDFIKTIPVPMPPNGDYDSFLEDVAQIESRIERHQTSLTRASSLSDFPRYGF